MHSQSRNHLIDSKSDRMKCDKDYNCLCVIQTVGGTTDRSTKYTHACYVKANNRIITGCL